MRRYFFPLHRSVPARLLGRALLLCLSVTFSLFMPQAIFGADDSWTGATSSTWSTTSNWSLGAKPGTADNAVFDRAITFQPDLAGTNQAIAGIWMKTGVTTDVTISGTSIITLNSGTIGGTSGLGIRVDNTSAYTLTISCGLKLGAAQTWLNNSSNVFTVTGAVNTNALALTINGSGSTTISGITSGTGSITKTGAGALTLSGANTYSGGTTLTSGTLNINNAGSGGTSSAIGTGTFTINGGTIDNTTAGAITLSTNNAVTFGGNFTFGGTQNLNFGGGKVSNGGSYTITLNGTNSTLTFGTMNNTLNAAQTTTVNGAGNTLVLGGYSLNNANQVDTINGSGNVTITGAVTNGGKATTSGLTYSGTGTLTLSGTNTYGGNTAVTSGTVLVNGSTGVAGTTVSVTNSGTTLGGTGTINGAVTVGSGAKLRGGTGSAASGTLTLSSSLTLQSGSIIELALGASGAHSTLARSGGGTWSFNTNQAFTFINLGAQPGNYTNIITGLASDPGETGWTITNAGWIGSFSYSGGNISLNVVAVPEPATCLAGFLALVVVGYHQRRRLFSLLLPQV
jgi:autotransporter-associated beta strand protein